MTNQIIIQSDEIRDTQSLITLVTDSLNSDNSKRAYRTALEAFISWYKDQGSPGLSKRIVQRYRNVLADSGLSSSTINLKLTAIRKLANEAADNNLIDQTLSNGISNIKGVKTSGVRTGNWLSLEQAQSLINAPDITSLKGLRDRAILAVLVGTGLRRNELANLQFENIKLLENRWVIVDIVGKGNKIRSIPINSWVKTCIDGWANTAGIEQTGYIFLRIRRGDNLVNLPITPQAVRDIVDYYSKQIGCNVAAHDLRRTFAKLVYKNGAALDQIQLSLGHESIQTTEKYLGVEQSLIDAPGDRINIKLD